MRVRRWVTVAVATIAALAVPQAAFAVSTPAGYPVAGIDVSSHDHALPLDWSAVAASGVRFAYVKATEGTGYVNPYFASDYAAAKAAGLKVGAYVFARPDLGNPVGQADFFVGHLQWANDARTLLPFVDLEWPYPGVATNACWNLTPPALTAWIRTFLTRIHLAIGRAPMIYTNANWWNPCTAGDTTFGGYPLDIAGYRLTPPALPAGWRSFALWQYAAGNPSVPGSYDADVANVALSALAGPYQSLVTPLAPPIAVAVWARGPGRYVSAGRTSLTASGGSPARFTLVDLGGGSVALRAATGRYVSAQPTLVANRTGIGAAQRFQLVHNVDGSVSLLASNHRYVTAANARSALAANGRGIGLPQEFTLSG